MAGTRISVDLVTSRYRRNLEVPCVFLTQGNATTKQPKFHRVSTDRCARVLKLGTFDKAENHESQNLRIRGIHEVDNALLTALERGERIAVN